ncbi:Ribulose-phosphate 3-epimerase [Planctomycetes bacterium Pla163]|uniref:Ribulose-phosphate 3-epimerase n=1 Tax=Rohdeia mirabilis TaxID=2528008 RepID=A0A518CZZ2_9BACT|nr:Ribulose-phosphate 3-epimerase [Planctomycetes bacterium Pla163]
MERTASDTASSTVGPPIVIAPSLLSSDFARLGHEVRRLEAAGADWHHVDVMDGHFVPNLTIGPPVVAALARVATRPLDVHLMISEPRRYAPDFAKAGAHVLTFHLEAVGEQHARETATAFRDLGISTVGISINPDTEVERLEGVLDLVDLVLIMSVYPGFGGQAFMPEVLSKTRWLREQGFRGHVEMDGGLDAETLPLCVAAGANALVSGSALFKAPDLAAEIAHFRDLAEGARTAPRRS